MNCGFVLRSNIGAIRKPKMLDIFFSKFRNFYYIVFGIEFSAKDLTEALALAETMLPTAEPQITVIPDGLGVIVLP